MDKAVFEGHAHQTLVGESLSSSVQLISGVVRESGIGPVLFLMFINDLVKLLQRSGITVKLFADDVKVYLEIVSMVDDTRTHQEMR